MSAPELKIVEDAPPLPAVKIVCRLGRISCKSATIDDSKTTRNSSRWVFDVEHDTHREPAFDLDLINFGTGARKNGVHLSISFTPMDEAAAKAHLRAPAPDRPRIEADDVGIARYRVTIDSSAGLGV